MNKEEVKEQILKAYAETELSWLQYYATLTSRQALNLSEPIYKQLVSIGYTKRVIALDKRCAFNRVTAESLITKDTSYSDLLFTDLPFDHASNIYTALEVWIIKHPELHDSIKKVLIA